MDQNNEPSRITFGGDEFQRPAQSFKTETPRVVRWVLKYSGGYVRDEKQATYVLIGFIAILFLLTGWLFSRATGMQALTETQMKQILKNQQNAYAPR